jgi:hypothetical protein
MKERERKGKRLSTLPRLGICLKDVVVPTMPQKSRGQALALTRQSKRLQSS